LEAVAAILKAGVRFFGLAPRRLADIYTDMAGIAGVMGAWERGQEVIAAMQQEIEAIRVTSRHPGRPDGRPLPETALHPSLPRVFCEEWGKPIIASQLWVAELVEAAGGEFIATPGKTIAPEEIASAHPDVIVAAWCGAGDRVPLEKIVEQRGWKDLPATCQGRVFCINDELLNTPATSLLGGLRALAWAFHPERFSQPRGIRQLQRR
jgi:iron complex transport system substrate-binding protein